MENNNCLVTKIIQSILFYVSQKKETHTGLEQLFLTSSSHSFAIRDAAAKLCREQQTLSLSLQLLHFIGSSLRYYFFGIGKKIVPHKIIFMTKNLKNISAIVELLNLQK